MSTIPLKLISYYWGRFNEIPLPVFMRAPGFKVYSWFFGVNLDEVAEPLESYRNLSEFFYRQLKPGCRPIDPRPNSVVSPADGRILQFGEVRSGGMVEQVKGMTYSLDALLGTQGSIHSEGESPNVAALVKKKLEGKGVEPGQTTARSGKGGDSDPDAAVYQAEEEFANVNGISYTLPSLLSGAPKDTKRASSGDVSVPGTASDSLEVGREIAKGTASSWFANPDKRLFFAVIYLAPGDYHRFHSPVSWVVERRRHFAGELYSVSPWLQSRLKDLFVLNERVVLLGRWRYGMFSMTPVGATNVGSIKIHFDRELRTNTLTHNATKADEQGGFAEATYKGASALLGGYPITKGGEMGGFNLGSTIVLVFEAPASNPNGPPGSGGFRFCVERGQKVKMGEAIGIVEE
jgi:phosphatidylserine decarboxylase